MPQTNAERVYVTVALFVGASFFSYIVGSVCGVARAPARTPCAHARRRRVQHSLTRSRAACEQLAKLGERDAEYQATMSNLNRFIREAKLDSELASRLRMYFRYQHRNAALDNFDDLMERMSPALRGEVAVAMHSDWIAEVDLFRMCPYQVRELTGPSRHRLVASRPRASHTRRTIRCGTVRRAPRYRVTPSFARRRVARRRC